MHPSSEPLNEAHLSLSNGNGIMITIFVSIFEHKKIHFSVSNLLTDDCVSSMTDCVFLSIKSNDMLTFVFICSLLLLLFVSLSSFLFNLETLYWATDALYTYQIDLQCHLQVEDFNRNNKCLAWMLHLAIDIICWNPNSSHIQIRAAMKCVYIYKKTLLFLP